MSSLPWKQITQSKWFPIRGINDPNSILGEGNVCHYVIRSLGASALRARNVISVKCDKYDIRNKQWKSVWEVITGNYSFYIISYFNMFVVQGTVAWNSNALRHLVPFTYFTYRNSNGWHHCIHVCFIWNLKHHHRKLN